MLVFEQMEITSGIALMILFVLMIPFYVLTVHFRHFAPLRDVQPILCLLTHVGYVLFTGHLFLAWRHERDLCYELAAMQLLDGVLLYGCFLCKHYALHKRYRVVATQLPTAVALILAALPFMLLSTYRIATREEDHCPNVDAVAGGIGLVLLVVTNMVFVLREHPSSHFGTAKHIENVALFCSVVFSFVHQWVSNDAVTLVFLFVSAVVANASLLGFTLPPIRLALSHGDEFTDEQRRIQNDSVFGMNSPMLADADMEDASCTSACGRRVANCLRRILASNDETSLSNTSISSPSTVHGATAAARSTSDLSRSRDRLVATSAAASPTKLRQEAETQKELQELVTAVQESDFYRLQRLMTRRGVALINVGDLDGRTLLHHAVRIGELNGIRFLLAMGADANKFDKKGRAPLHEAVRSRTAGDRSACITELLRCGAVVNLPTAGGLTPLHIAVESGQLGAVNTLLRHDANPLFGHEKEDATLSWQQAHITHCQRTNCNVSRKSPLTVAVEMGDDKIVSSMLHSLKMSKSRLNFDIRCVHGMTLLHVALCLGNHATVAVLMLEGSCSPWTVNEETSMNCLHMAAVGDSALSVCALLQHMGAPDLIPEEAEFTADATAVVPSADLAFRTQANKPNRDDQNPLYHGQRSNVSLPGANNSHSSLHSSPPASSAAKQGDSTKRLHVLGTGTEHATFLAVHAQGSSASMPNSPSESRSRQASFMRRVQYGCCVPAGAAPFVAPNPVAMGFGEAMSVLREHIPNATADGSKLSELEANVERVLGFLRTKCNVPEMERVQCAMHVVAKRLKASSTRSLSMGAMMLSSQSIPGPLHTTGSMRSRPGGDTNVLDSIRRLLRSVDNTGMSPLHYAIQQRNVTLVYLYAAYGAVVLDSELPKRRGRSGSSNSDSNSVVESYPSGQLGGTLSDFLVDGGSSGQLRAGGESPPQAEPFHHMSVATLGTSPGVMNDTQTFLSSLTQPPALPSADASADALEEFSERNYARDVRRYVEDDETLQDRIMRALKAGVAIFANSQAHP